MEVFFQKKVAHGFLFLESCFYFFERTLIDLVFFHCVLIFLYQLFFLTIGSGAQSSKAQSKYCHRMLLKTCGVQTKRIYTYLVCIYEAKAFLKLANSKPCRLGSQCYRKQGLQEQGSEANQACRVKAMQACIANK